MAEIIEVDFSRAQTPSGDADAIERRSFSTRECTHGRIRVDVATMNVKCMACDESIHAAWWIHKHVCGKWQSVINRVGIWEQRIVELKEKCAQLSKERDRLRGQVYREKKKLKRGE